MNTCRTAAAAALAVWCVTSAGQAQIHSGDILLRADAWGRLQTGSVDQSGEPVRGVRVFAATFGEAPNFTNDPGFDSGEDSFVPGTSVGFQIVQAVRKWNSATGSFDVLPPERISVRLGPLGPVLTPMSDQSVNGFSLTADGAGRFHHHLGYTLQAPASSGIYLLRLVLTSPQFATSRSFYMVFNQMASAGEHQDAVNWVSANLACPGDLNDDAAVDFGDFLTFFNAFDTLEGAADINFDDSVDFADFLEFFNRFDATC